MTATLELLDRVPDLLAEGRRLAFDASRTPSQEGCLREIERELRSLLWCDPCQEGDYAGCTERQDGRGKGKRSTCPMTNYGALLERARNEW